MERLFTIDTGGRMMSAQAEIFLVVAENSLTGNMPIGFTKGGTSSHFSPILASEEEGAWATVPQQAPTTCDTE